MAAFLLQLTLLWTTSFVGAQLDSSTLAERVEGLSKRLRESELGTLEEPHRLLQKGIERLRKEKFTAPLVDYQIVNASAVAHELADQLSKVFANRKESLLIAVREAEAIVQDHVAVTKLENVDTYFSLDFKGRTWKVPVNMTSLPEFRGEVFEPASTAYVTRDVYYKVPSVVNGIAWTAKLDEIWKENRVKRNVSGWQYFGSNSGFMRVYPGRKWTYVDGEENNNYNPAYDLRRLPIYQQGVTSPKDVLILVDTSGSVFGQPLQYIKIAAFSFIETLNENDYVNIMTFSQQAQLITPQISTLLPATERNKKILKRYLDSVVPYNQAMYSDAFEAAFELFDGANFGNSSEFLSSGFGANCNQLVLLLTDGASDFEGEVFHRMNRKRRSPLHGNVSESGQVKTGEQTWEMRPNRRVFAYALGQQQKPAASLRHAACSNRGHFTHLLDIGSIKSIVEKYVDVVQQPMLQRMPTPVSFSNRYFDPDGMGFVVSLLAPVYNKTDESVKLQSSRPSSVLGLMANDVSIAQLVNDTVEPISKQLGANGYVFVINQNGFAVIHPSLHNFEDLTVLSSGNVKDKQVNDGVDLLDLEYDDAARRDIRKRMIDGQSGTVVLHDALMRCTHNDTALYRANVTYAFAPVRDTPFSVGVLLPTGASVRKWTWSQNDAERQQSLQRLLSAAAATLQRQDCEQNADLAMLLAPQKTYCRSLPGVAWALRSETGVEMTPSSTASLEPSATTGESLNEGVTEAPEAALLTENELVETDSLQLALLRLAYSHFEALADRVLNASNFQNSQNSFTNDCDTEHTLQLLLDAVAMQPAVASWTGWSSAANVSDDSQAVLSKLLVSANSLTVGSPKARFDDYLLKGLLSPLAQSNALFEIAGLLSASQQDNAYLHFEALPAIGESERLFVATPLRVPLNLSQHYFFGVAAVEIQPGYLDLLLQQAVPECAHQLCYLLDEFSYVVACNSLARRSSQLTIGAPLVDLNGPLFLAMLHQQVFVRTNFYNTQEKCDTPVQVASASSASGPFGLAFWSQIFSAIAKSFSLWTDFTWFFSSFPQVQAVSAPKSGRKSKKRGAAQQFTEEEDERRCVFNVTRFVLNRTAFLTDSQLLHATGTLRCDLNCEKQFSLVQVPNTSLFLLLAAANFTCSIVRHSHSGNLQQTGSVSAGNLINFTVNSFDANCAVVNGVPNNTILQLGNEFLTPDGVVRLEHEVRLGDGEYAALHRNRYRRRPSSCYDFWANEQPTCTAWSLLSTSHNLLVFCYVLLFRLLLV